MMSAAVVQTKQMRSNLQRWAQIGQNAACVSSTAQRGVFLSSDTHSSLDVGLEKNSLYSWCSSWHTWTMKAQPLRTWKGKNKNTT